MKRKVKELKRIARGNLMGNYIPLIRAYILVSLILTLVEFPFSMLQTQETLSTQNIIYYIAITLINIISIILVAGQYKLHLSLARTGKMNLTDLFEPVKNQPDRYILANLILFVLSLLSMLPLFAGLAIIYFYESIAWYLVALLLSTIGTVLSMYVSLTFNLVFFVLIDHPDMKAIEALKATRKLIMGYKKRYLYMQYSFLGMLLAAALSFGIGMLWVEPYMTQTVTLFYLDIKDELDAVQTERRNMEETPEPTTINHYV